MTAGLTTNAVCVIQSLLNKVFNAEKNCMIGARSKINLSARINALSIHNKLTTGDKAEYWCPGGGGGGGIGRRGGVNMLFSIQLCNTMFHVLWYVVHGMEQMATSYVSAPMGFVLTVVHSISILSQRQVQQKKKQWDFTWEICVLELWKKLVQCGKMLVGAYWRKSFCCLALTRTTLVWERRPFRCS